MSDPQRWNRYAYVRNNPLALIDPDGQADISVFRPTATSTSKAWAAIQAEAPKHGNTVTIYNGKDATTERYTQALSTPGAEVVFSGHSVHDVAGNVGSVQLSNGEVGTMTSTSAAPTAASGVQASSVGVFACQSEDLSGQYSSADYTGVSSGSDAGTTLSALDSGAAFYTDSLARSQDTSTATDQATGAIQRSPDAQDQNGDRAELHKKEE